MNLLVAEDDEVAATELSESLDDIATCHFVRGVKLEQSLLQSIDGMVLDLNLIDGSGIDILLALEPLRRKPWVILSSGIANDMVEECAAVAEMRGIDVVGIFRKPYNPADLRDTVKKQAALHARPPVFPIEVIDKSVEEACRTEDLDFVFQPIVSAADGRLASAEALLRYTGTNKTWKSLSPDKIIQNFRDTGRISEFNYWFTNNLAEKIIQISASNPVDQISINLDPDDLTPDFCKTNLFKLISIANNNDFHIEIELTERNQHHDMLRMKEIILSLRINGYSIALDDFGIGHSNFDRLKSLMIEKIKVDRLFFKSALHDGAVSSYLKSLCSMCIEKGILITIEGIETKDEWEAARDYGASYLQGFGISRPIKMKNLLSLEKSTIFSADDNECNAISWDI